MAKPKAKNLKKADELGPLSVEEFVDYLGRDLNWLQGFACGLPCDRSANSLGGRLHGMQRNLKRFKITLGQPDPEPAAEEVEADLKAPGAPTTDLF